VPATMGFDVQPQRGDMLRIQHWLEQEAAVKHEAVQHTHEYKARQTDSLLRDYLSQAIDAENARRANIEAEWGVPYAGVLAEQHRLAELTRKGMKPPAAEPVSSSPTVTFAPAPRRIRRPRVPRGRSAEAVSDSRFTTPHASSMLASPGGVLSALRSPARRPLDPLFQPRAAAYSLSGGFDLLAHMRPSGGVAAANLQDLPGFPTASSAAARDEGGPPVSPTRTRLASRSKK